MKYREQSSPSEQIKNINCVTDGNRCTLSWLWPRGVDFVYIYRAKYGDEFSIDDITRENAKLYTRDEYMEYGGYHETSNDIGRYTYYIMPLVRENGEMLLINQNASDNIVTISAGKVRINFSVKEKIKLIGGRKIVRITVTPDAPVLREVLCYVKKAGSIPTGVKDGMVFPFLQDFNAGENVMPEIEIGRDEYIRLFLTDNGAYGDIYQLIFR